MIKTICNKSVLIIDDDAGTLRALYKVLTGQGAVVTRAQWAGDALGILTGQKQKFDLVITDLQMPFMTGVMTGVSMVYAIHELLPALPVIVLTAYGSPEVKSKCLSMGASAFLEKPLNTPQLLRALEDALLARSTAS